MNPQEIIAEGLEQIRGMWRYRWLAAGITWLISVCGWLVVYSMPDVYRASAQVFVETNSLLGPLMKGLTAQQDPLDEVQLVSKAVLTRPNLEEVAHTTDLTLRAQTLEEREALVTELQRRIRVSGGRDNIFTIQYQDTSREKSVAVVAAVLDTFVENALGNQGDDANVTERALGGEIRAHEDRLRAAEAALAQFKRDNLGYMPGDAGDYHSRLQAALAAVSEAENEMRLLTERRDELRRQIAGEEPVFGLMPAPVGAAACSQREHIARLESELSGLRVTYTDKHPRVVSLHETIASLERQCATDGAPVIAGEGGAAPTTQLAQPLEANPVYQSMRIALSSTEVEFASRRAELESRQAAVGELRRDVDKIVQVETELKQLNRDYEVVQARHQELLRRWEDLQAKKRLDPVTDTVQFRRIEPPFSRAEPSGPNRTLLLGAVFVLAFGAGAAAAFALNQIDPRFITRRSLVRAANLPVLGSISLIPTPEIAARERVELIAWLCAYIALFAGTVAVVAFAGQGSALVRSFIEGVGA